MSIITNFTNFITNARHILYVSYKPSEDRYKKTAKVILIGVVTIGLVGFIIAIIISLLVAGNFALV